MTCRCLTTTKHLHMHMHRVVQAMTNMRRMSYKLKDDMEEQVY